MTLKEHRLDTTLILSITGELDNAASDQFRELALERIADGVSRLIVDFGQTTFVASMGIRALFIPAKELKAKGGSVVLAALNREVRNLLLVAGVLDLFPVFATPEEALAHHCK